MVVLFKGTFSMSKYAILLDAGFLIKKLYQKNKSFPTAKDVLDECEIIKAHSDLKENDLLRIYFYHAMPSDHKLINPIDASVLDLENSSASKNHIKLMEDLELEPYFALRLGELVARGWNLKKSAISRIEKDPSLSLRKRDLTPNIQQKGVDLKIGLDIARLSLNGTVDKIVICTGDSDIMPCFKFARREGIQIFLHSMGHSIKKELRAHADVVIT